MSHLFIWNNKHKNSTSGESHEFTCEEMLNLHVSHVIWEYFQHVHVFMCNHILLFHMASSVCAAISSNFTS